MTEKRRAPPVRRSYSGLTLEERFWSRVDKRDDGECWPWMSSRNASGYGRFWNTELRCAVMAHRFSYELRNGAIPRGMLCCHHCDIPICVNPAHLFIGTDADNAADRTRKGRSQNGERIPQHKLKLADVAEIRSTPKKHGYAGPLALKFGVSQNTIRRARRGINWRSV